MPPSTIKTIDALIFINMRRSSPQQRKSRDAELKKYIDAKEGPT